MVYMHKIRRGAYFCYRVAASEGRRCYPREQPHYDNVIVYEKLPLASLTRSSSRGVKGVLTL